MRDFKGMKRQRGRNRSGGVSSPMGGKPQQNANRAFDSNGPENIKVRGHAQHVFEKYQQLARDATSSGDRVLAENFLQHAEHYFRLLRTLQPNRPLSDFIARDNFASGYDIDFEDESGAQAIPDEPAAEASQDSADGGQGGEQQQRGDYQSQPRENRDGGQYRDRDQNRDGQNRDGQQRDRWENRQNRDRNRYDRDRPQGDRPQSDRPQGDRPQGERPQSERPQSDRPQSDRQREDRGYRAEGQDGEARNDDRGYRDREYRDDRPRDDRPRDDRPREDRPRDDRPPREGRRDRYENRDRGYRDDRGERSDPLAVVEPRAEPLTTAPSAPAPAVDSNTRVLRSRDGEVSHAPAFLQAAAPVPAPSISDGDEAPAKRPRGRPRKVKADTPADEG